MASALARDALGAAGAYGELKARLREGVDSGTDTRAGWAGTSTVADLGGGDFTAVACEVVGRRWYLDMLLLMGAAFCASIGIAGTAGMLGTGSTGSCCCCAWARRTLR